VRSQRVTGLLVEERLEAGEDSADFFGPAEIGNGAVFEIG
jgi:hypothetical protein